MGALNQLRTVWRSATGYQDDIETVVDAFEQDERLEHTFFPLSTHAEWNDGSEYDRAAELIDDAMDTAWDGKWANITYRLNDDNAVQASLGWRATYRERKEDGFTAIINVDPQSPSKEAVDVDRDPENLFASEYGHVKTWDNVKAGVRFYVPLDPDIETAEGIADDTADALAYYESLSFN